MKTTITANTIRNATAIKAIVTGIVAQVASRSASRWRYVRGVSQGVFVRHGLAGPQLVERLAAALGLASPAMACRPACPSTGDSSKLNRSSAVA